MKLSVCLITYNHERFIRPALDGVLAQEFDAPWEVVVGDDCSPDATGAIVREYAARRPDLIRVLDTPHNLGGHGKQNFLRSYAACTGEYIALLEGDDYWSDPEKLRRQVELLDANPHVSFCFHPVVEVDPDGKAGPVMPRTRRTDFAFADLFPHNFIPTCSVVIRRRLLPTVPAWVRSVMPGDWPLHMLSAAHGPFRMVPRVMGAYRVHPGGVWSHRNVTDRHTTTLTMLHAARENLPAEHGPALDRGIAFHRFQRAWALAEDGDRDRARAELDAVLADPAREHLSPLLVRALKMKLRWPAAFAAAARGWRAVTRLGRRP